MPRTNVCVVLFILRKSNLLTDSKITVQLSGVHRFMLKCQILRTLTQSLTEKGLLQMSRRFVVVLGLMNQVVFRSIKTVCDSTFEK